MNDRNILITGASGGIGSEISRILAAQGHRLILSARDKNRLSQLVRELSGEGHMFVCADLSKPEDIVRLSETARQNGVDTLINCMGKGQLSLLENVLPDEADAILQANLLAPIKLCLALIPYFQTLPRATIINVGSILGSIGYAGSALYCASKFGLRGFTESLRRELADSQIRVIYFAPRATDTELNSAATKQMNEALGNRVDSPALVARELSYLLSDDKSADHYLGWPEAFFVRLNSLFPAIVDKALKKQLAVIRRYASQPHNPTLERTNKCDS